MNISLMQSETWYGLVGPKQAFTPYETSHTIVVVLSVLIGGAILYSAKHKLDPRKQRRLITGITAYIVIVQAIILGIKIVSKTFDLTQDLPFHLCSLLPTLLLVSFVYRSQYIFNILYFWIITGSIQAIVTPDLHAEFPHIVFIRYWTVHLGIVFCGIYGIYVLGYRVRKEDLLRSAIAVNITAMGIYIINLLTGGNYMFLMGKPKGDSLYDYMGPWPYCFITMNVVLILFFHIAYFIARDKRTLDEHTAQSPTSDVI